MPSAHKIRVRWPYPRTGRLLLAALLASACGALAFPMQSNLRYLILYHSDIQPKWPFEVVDFFSWYGLGLVGPILFAWSCTRIRDAVFVGIVWGALFLPVAFFVSWLHQPGAMIYVARGEYVMVVLIRVVGYAFGAAVATVFFRSLFNVVFGKIIEQNGLLCAVCGYPIGHVETDTCSECGTKASTQTRRQGVLQRAAGWIQQKRRAVAIITFVFIALLSTFCYWLLRPYVLFDQRFVRPGTFIYRFTYSYPQYLIAYRPLEEYKDLGIVLECGREHNFAPARMLISLVTKDDKGTVLVTNDKRVYTQLTPAQTWHVLDHGVPSSLIDAMIEKGPATGWNPRRPNTPGMPLYLSGIEISAEEHFPPEVNDNEE